MGALIAVTDNIPVYAGTQTLHPWTDREANKSIYLLNNQLITVQHPRMRLDLTLLFHPQCSFNLQPVKGSDKPNWLIISTEATFFCGETWQ